MEYIYRAAIMIYIWNIFVKAGFSWVNCLGEGILAEGNSFNLVSEDTSNVFLELEENPKITRHAW